MSEYWALRDLRKRDFGYIKRKTFRLRSDSHNESWFTKAFLFFARWVKQVVSTNWRLQFRVEGPGKSQKKVRNLRSSTSLDDRIVNHSKQSSCLNDIILQKGPSTELSALNVACGPVHVCLGKGKP